MRKLDLFTQSVAALVPADFMLSMFVTHTFLNLLAALDKMGMFMMQSVSSTKGLILTTKDVKSASVTMRTH